MKKLNSKFAWSVGKLISERKRRSFPPPGRRHPPRSSQRASVSRSPKSAKPRPSGGCESTGRRAENGLWPHRSIRGRRPPGRRSAWIQRRGETVPTVNVLPPMTRFAGSTRLSATYARSSIRAYMCGPLSARPVSGRPRSFRSGWKFGRLGRLAPDHPVAHLRISPAGRDQEVRVVTARGRAPEPGLGPRSPRPASPSRAATSRCPARLRRRSPRRARRARRRRDPSGRWDAPGAVWPRSPR